MSVQSGQRGTRRVGVHISHAHPPCDAPKHNYSIICSIVGIDCLVCKGLAELVCRAPYPSFCARLGEDVEAGIWPDSARRRGYASTNEVTVPTHNGSRALIFHR